MIDIATGDLRTFATFPTKSAATQAARAHGHGVTALKIRGRFG